MKLLLAAVLVLMVSSLAQAVPETRQLGPFTVSFDMNTNINHTILTPEAGGDSSATPYLLTIKTNNTTWASISITEYANPADSTLQMQGALAFWKMRARGVNATIPMNKTLDGKDGFLLDGMPFPGSGAPDGYKLFQAQYWLDSKDCSQCGSVSVGTISVDIISTYPQEVTTNLMDSIHVEKGGEAGMNASSIITPAPTGSMPPGAAYS